MKALFRYAILSLILLAGYSSGVSAQPDNQLVQPLLNENQNMFEWYQNVATADVDARYGGAYVIVAVDDTLYLGFSVGVPTHDHSGPLLAAYNDQRGLHLISQLNEQDVNRIKAVGDKLFIPGYDPYGSDGWNAGNLYIYDTETEIFQKLRYRYDSPHFVDVTVTNEQGQYRFSNLKPSSYILKFIPPEGYVFTSRKVGENHWVNSNPFQDSGGDHTCRDGDNMPFVVNVPLNENTIDAGMFQPASGEDVTRSAVNAQMQYQPDPTFYSGNMTIGDLVWKDLNRDGTQDRGEPGIPDVRVELYTHDPYFPCVIHASGIWGDPETGTIYYNGGVIGGNITFISEDFGETWRMLAQDTPLYWATDLTFFNGYFYKIHRHLELSQTVLHYDIQSILLYSDDLENWQEVELPVPEDIVFRDDRDFQWIVTGMSVNETDAFVTFQDQLLLLQPSGEAFISIREGADFDVIPVTGADLSGILDDFHEPDYPEQIPNEYAGASNRYNTMANANDELLYVIGGDNRLYATPDLLQWYPVADFDQIDAGAPLISLTYWPEKGWLVAATAGREGSLYYVEHQAIMEVAEG